MTSGSRSSPAITSAGSPGSNCCSEKISTETKNSVGTICIRRRARKLNIRVASLQLEADDAHETVGHLPIAFEFCSMRDDDAAVVEIEQGLLVLDQLRENFVTRLALDGVGHQPRVRQRLVGLRVVPRAVVLRRTAVQKNKAVAVGIDTTAPGEHEGLVVAGLRLLEPGREFADAD